MRGAPVGSAPVMEASELRRIWTDFFVARGHTSVPSAGLIPHHPSAPMFVNSGMMPFVPYFLGEEEPPLRPARATSVQKCVRARWQAQRPRRHRTEPAPPQLLRDARELQLRRLLQGRSDPVGVRVRDRGARHRRRPGVDHRAHHRRRGRGHLGRCRRIPARPDPATRQGQLLGDG